MARVRFAETRAHVRALRASAHSSFFAAVARHSRVGRAGALCVDSRDLVGDGTALAATTRCCAAREHVEPRVVAFRSQRHGQGSGGAGRSAGRWRYPTGVPASLPVRLSVARGRLEAERALQGVGVRLAREAATAAIDARAAREALRIHCDHSLRQTAAGLDSDSLDRGWLRLRGGARPARAGRLYPPDGGRRSPAGGRRVPVLRQLFGRGVDGVG
jgi:hypothetical protein